MFALFLVLLLPVDPSLSAVKVQVVHDQLIDSGSGTVIKSTKDKSLVLTNRHVVPTNAGRISIQFGERFIPARWLGVDERADLCVLEVSETLPSVVLGEDEPTKGVSVKQWGYPEGQRKFKEGVTVGHQQNATVNGVPVYYTTIRPIPGDSGCGVFDSAGRLVAVNWDGTHEECCVGLSDIKRFVARFK